MVTNVEFKKLKQREVYRDPIHDYINVDYEIINQLIATKEIQRLKRIHQLGGTLQVFPTAEHSRFSHSLGTYEIARYIVETVDAIKESMSEEDVVTLLCAALLHDVGHGPFSHAFELIHPVHHETYTCKIILEESEVNTVLKQIAPDFPDKVASVINKTHPNVILSQLISSQIDADRIDYLLRDAFFTGTPYGYIDVKRLIRIMSVKDNKIVFKESGIANLENFVMGRYHMYRTVYYHPASTCYEIIVTKLINRFFELRNKGFKYKGDYCFLLPFESKNPISASEYTDLDEYCIYYYTKLMSQEDDPILKDLSLRFLNRKLLKTALVKNIEEANKYKDMVINKGFNPAYYFYSVKPNQVIYKNYGINDKANINILMRDGSIKELSEVSAIMSALTNADLSSRDDTIVIYV